MRQMEASPGNRFLEFRRGRNVFAFNCPVCGSEGELGVRTDNRNRLVACPENWGAFFMVRLGRGLFSKPSLEYAFGEGATSSWRKL